MKIGKKALVVGCISEERQLRRYARAAPGHCDAVEVRLDLTGLCGGEWTGLCRAIRRQGMPVILTIRDSREGGAWRGREADRLALYLAGLKSVSAVDMEIGAHALMTLAGAAKQVKATVVGSFHDFKGTPTLARLRAIEVRGRHMGADVVKVAVKVRTEADVATLFAFPHGASGPICVLGMGDRAGITRVALPCAGSCLAYGALGRATAPGQMDCRRLCAELRKWGARK